ETITGSDNTVTITADTHPSIFAADAAGVRFQVSTTGQHPDPSPHSAAAATTFVDAPSCQILTPVDGDTLTEPSVSVTLAYQQAEGAELHTAHIELIDQEGYLVEAITTRDLSPVTFTTHLADGAQYTVAVHVVSAHGIASQQALSFIDVSYPSPYPAGVGVQWMEETAAAQLLLAVDLTSADGEDDGQTEKEMPTSFSLWRIIGDNRELLFDRHPWDGQDLVILDPLPALAGSTRWEIITFSDEGTASAPTTAIYDATPGRWVYFNTGPSWGDSVRIFADLTVASKPERTRALFEAAGRQRPIALFAREGSLEVSGSATIVPTLSSTVTNADGEGTEFNVVTFDGGSTVKDIEEFLLTADLVCYRDTKGRRVFGALTGSISSEKGHTGQFSYTVIEAT
ncbi:MAG: copper resistance protein CopC, partial [Cellulomonadaceae bacterium]|nr:copper resistance protein CopC [Cellulomonadaceae bacterium]